jgi:phenylacetate-CoA ligase
VKQWQLEQRPEGLLLRLVPGRTNVVPETIVAALQGALAEAGARRSRIDVALVDAIAKTALGKAPLIRAL